MLNRILPALLATTLLAAPATARDKTLYLGAEAGIAWGTDTDIDAARNGSVPALSPGCCDRRHIVGGDAENREAGFDEVS